MEAEARCVLAFAGHMIDQPGRSCPRFPSWAESAVQLKIRKEIARLSPAAAISSGACGGDIIFAEESLKHGASLCIILPFQDRNDFIQRSVAYAGEHWVERFNKVCDQARLYYVKPDCYQDDKDYEDNQHAVIFFAMGFAAARNMQLICLLLYDDTQAGDEIGGTRSFLDLCEQLQIKCDRIDMVAIREDVAANS